MERILVLGATGKLNTLIAARLNEMTDNVSTRLTSSRAEGVEALREQYPNLEVVQADWYDPASLKVAMKDVDRVLFITPDHATDEVAACNNLIDAVREAGSVSQVLRHVAIPPGLTKEDLEQKFLDTKVGATHHVIAKPILDASGLPITYLNLACWIMFNLPWICGEEVVKNHRLAIPGAANAPRRWVSEDDIADVTVALLTEPAEKHVGKDYLMTGVELLGFEDIAQILTEVTGNEVVYVDDAGPFMAAMGDNFPGLMVYFEHEMRDYAGVPGSDAKLEILGEPQVTVAQYIASRVDQFR